MTTTSIYQPYHESDHLLTLAYNVLAGGKRLQDIKLQRNDEGWPDALGAETIPDPTTVGDFLRRFDENEIMALQESVNTIRKKLWKRQPEKFFKQVIIHIDGLVAETTDECKQGMNISHTKAFGVIILW